MRSAFLLVFLCLVVQTVGICQDEELPLEWTFDDEDSIRKWTSTNQIILEIDDVKDKAGNERSVLITKSTGNDPYVHPDRENFVQFDGGKYDTLYIGVRANKTSTWQIYFITTEDATYSERQRQNFQVNASDDFQNLEFKMTAGGWQQEQITGFRLDPGTVADVEAEIDYLSPIGVPAGVLPEPVEYNGSLATTWGQIRSM